MIVVNSRSKVELHRGGTHPLHYHHLIVSIPPFSHFPRRIPRLVNLHRKVRLLNLIHRNTQILVVSGRGLRPHGARLAGGRPTGFLQNRSVHIDSLLIGFKSGLSRCVKRSHGRFPFD